MEVWKPLHMGLILASRLSPGKNVGVGKFVDWGWSCHLALTAGDGMSGVSQSNNRRAHLCEDEGWSCSWRSWGG